MPEPENRYSARTRTRIQPDSTQTQPDVIRVRAELSRVEMGEVVVVEVEDGEAAEGVERVVREV